MIPHFLAKKINVCAFFSTKGKRKNEEFVAKQNVFEKIVEFYKIL